MTDREKSKILHGAISYKHKLNTLLLLPVSKVRVQVISLT